MVEYFRYDNEPSYQYGLIVTGTKTFGAPRRRIETLHVYGRSGDILFDEDAYDNIYVSYDVEIIKDFKTNAREIRGWLLSRKGYHELSDTYNPQFYRYATYFNSLDYDVVDHLMTLGKATITFYAMPQRYDGDGDIPTEITGNTTATLINPYQFKSKPLIEVSSTGTITVNGYTITVNSLPLLGNLTIDCETMQCTDGVNNCNSMVTIDEFPVLGGGENIVTTNLSNSTKKTYITPRWWTL